MKKLFLTITNLLLVCSLVYAQKDQKATAILDEMSKKYQNMKSFNERGGRLHKETGHFSK